MLRKFKNKKQQKTEVTAEIKVFKEPKQVLKKGL